MEMPADELMRDYVRGWNEGRDAASPNAARSLLPERIAKQVTVGKRLSLSARVGRGRSEAL